MKKLLITTAIIEALTGLLLIAAPAAVASMLPGEESLGAVALIIARIAGAALIALAIACLLLRKSDHAKDMVTAMLFYNFAAAAILMYSQFSLPAKDFGLALAAGLHLLLGAWSIVAIQSKSKQS